MESLFAEERFNAATYIYIKEVSNVKDEDCGSLRHRRTGLAGLDLVLQCAVQREIILSQRNYQERGVLGRGSLKMVNRDHEELKHWFARQRSQFC